MNYREAVDFLFSSTPQFQQIGAAAYKPGLDSTHRLDDAFGNPHRKFKIIHVGGTNGKGSTAHTIASILQAQGYRTALYTSPHMVDFRERIKVDGEMIPERDVVDFVERYQALEDLKDISFFELTTIMAFEYFAGKKVDYAVVEVGLGGRLDSTNIVSPVLSVITNISKDHVAQLGNTLTAIAAEKAGIIKPGIPVVIGEAEGDVKKVFEEKAIEENAPITFAKSLEGWCFDAATETICYPKTPFGEIHGELTGDCQPKNAATIITAIEKLIETGTDISNESIIKGFRNVVETTGLMGRWAKLADSPTVICDTGHNEGGWKYIAERLKGYGSRLRMVIGFVNDKDVSTIMAMMPTTAKYYFTRASIPRALPSEEVKKRAESFGLYGKTYNSVKEAVEAALKESAPDETIFIGGSTFIIADLMASEIFK